VLCPALFCALAERFWGLRVEPESEVTAALLGIFISLAWLFLLIASPFFLKRLGWIALAGWIIAFGTYLFAVLTQIYEGGGIPIFSWSSEDLAPTTIFILIPAAIRRNQNAPEDRGSLKRRWFRAGVKMMNCGLGVGWNSGA